MLWQVGDQSGAEGRPVYDLSVDADKFPVSFQCPEDDIQQG